MGILSTVSKQVYDVQIHTHEFENEVSMFSNAPMPTDEFRAANRLTQFSKVPWRTYLQNGGMRRTKIKFGPDRDSEFRDYINMTPNDLSSYLNNTTGFAFGGLGNIFMQTKVESKPGITAACMDKKIAELFETSGDDYSVIIDQDFNIDDDGRKEWIKSSGLIDTNNYFANPMPSLIPNAMMETNFSENLMHPSEKRFYCINFWPENCNTFDQLFRTWNQCGYIKFRDERLVIPKRGTKDIIISSGHLKLSPQDDLHGGTIAPSRAYELKTASREFDTNNSGIVIHLWRE
jgi:hypothetical protein